MMRRVAVISVYFGKLPDYFDLWLNSCKYNASIDFYVITDQKYEGLPDNVRVIPMTLKDMKLQATQKLGIDVSLGNPYKCCDYKPVYGIIFSDILSQYDYWGHCDIDLIWGNLESFFDKYELEKYDRFLLLGHLCLYRNTPQVNMRYKAPGAKYDYETVFSNEQNFVFDEFGGMVPIYLTNGYSMFVKRIFADISPKHKRFTLSESCYLDKPDRNYRKQVFFWDQGRVYRTYLKGKSLCTEEFLYIHFRGRKSMPKAFEEIPEAFYLSSNGFTTKDTPVDESTIATINPYSFTYELYESICAVVKRYTVLVTRKLKKIFRSGDNGK